MKVRVQVVVESEQDESQVVKEIAQIEREVLQPENLGLSLAEAKTLMSYGLSVKLLQEVLPIEGTINATAIRNNLHACAQRLEEELGEENGAYIEGCPMDWEKLPRPDLPLVVGMDGGYVRSYDFKSKQKGNFEVMAGKSIKADGSAKRFSFAECYQHRENISPQIKGASLLLHSLDRMNC